MAETEILSMWVIYDRPLDHPEHFVVRRWVILSSGQKDLVPPKATDEVQLASSLEEARKLVPDGKLRMPRFPNDEPQIVEVWT